MQTPALRSEINITPLVDVCLVLLILFMVITPMIANGPTVALPETTAPAALAQPASILTLRLDGTLDLDGQPLARTELVDALHNLSARGRTLQLRADRRLPYRDVRAVLATASRAEFAGAELATLRRDASARH